jgi:hypothetical protein
MGFGVRDYDVRFRGVSHPKPVRAKGGRGDWSHEAAQVIGHERKGMTYGRYSAGLGIKELKEVVEKIVYVG